jgi:glycosyltransferase involved in cell wall biosynthesis
MDVVKFFEIISRAQLNLSSAERSELIRFASDIELAYHQLDSSGQHDILAALKNLSKHKAPYNGLIIHSLLYHITQNIIHLRAIAKYLKHYTPDLEEGVATQNALGFIQFNSSGDTGEVIESILPRSIYKKLFQQNLEHVKQLYDVVAENKTKPFEPNNRVVIVTRQLLMPPHAPTVDTLKFAVRLIKEYSKEVLIIVSSEASCHYDGAIAPAYVAQREERFVGSNTINYDGLDISYVICGDGVLSQASMAQGIKIIDTFMPEMILSVSAPSLLAEVFAKRSFCFIYPTSKGVPLTQDCYFHTWNEPDETMNAIVQKEDLETNYLFAQHPGFDVKAQSNSLTRSQFSIPDDAFVFTVVGIRLHREVDANFFGMLKKITKNPKAHIVFAGTFDDYENTVLQHGVLRDRCSYIGFQRDIMAVYNISDAFLNPARRGGGSGIVYALQAGLPVLSLPEGDAGLAAAGFPALNTYDEMAEKAQALMLDAVTLDEYKRTAINEAPKFSDRAELLKRIMQEFDHFSKRYST